MTPPTASEWPTDPDSLAAIAKDLSRPPEDRNRAMENLVPTIDRIARRVASRFPSATSDVVLEISSEVWESLSGYQVGRSFERWCYGLVRNHFLDHIRRQQRERGQLGRLADQRDNYRLQQALEGALTREGQLSESDLTRLRNWPLLPRLVLLCLSGLYDRVPSGDWDAWVEEYRGSRGDLPEPFPPLELRDCETLAARNGLLATAMQIPRNTPRRGRRSRARRLGGPPAGVHGGLPHCRSIFAVGSDKLP